MFRLRFPRRRYLIALAALVVAAVVAVASAVALLRSAPEAGSPSSSSSASNSAANADPYRPAFHNAPESHWMNDPQRPLLIGGLWHAFYLYNPDYPRGEGTSWRHMTSTDLVHWKDEGTAIEKFANGHGDIETGSAVVDEEGTAGFGRGALVALLTQQLDGVQQQSLFSSTDGGRTFTSFAGNPVMPNPGQKDWRDPKIIRDDAHGQWVMALAEGTKIGFYTSKDLRSWQYASGFQTTGGGVLECPDLFELNLDGDPKNPRWVLMAGANGDAEGRTTGTAYWTGTWDGAHFTADGRAPRHQWLDDGPDYYAAVTWDDPRKAAAERRSSRYAIAWMNNWAYARDLPSGGWSGADSIPRSIRLATVDGVPRLVSEPLPALTEGHATSQVPPQTLGVAPLERTQPGGGAFALDAELERAPGDTGHEARIQLTSGGTVYATVGYDFDAGQAFLVRGTDAFHGTPSQDAVYRAVRTAPVERAQRVRLRVFVDKSSVEAFVDDGARSLSALSFPLEGDRRYSVLTSGGTLSLRSLAETPLGGS